MNFVVIYWIEIYLHVIATNMLYTIVSIFTFVIKISEQNIVLRVIHLNFDFFFFKVFLFFRKSSFIHYKYCKYLKWFISFKKLMHNIFFLSYINEYIVSIFSVFCHTVNFEFPGWVLVQNLQYDTSWTSMVLCVR